MLEQFWQDLRVAWRGLQRARGFAVVAVLTLAVGIAGTTAMFAFVHGVLLRPLPVRDQSRLIVGWKQAPTSAVTRWPFRPSDISVIAASSRAFETVAGVGYQSPHRVVAVENGVAGYVQLVPVTGDFFEVLGSGMLLGRGLTRADDVAAAAPVAVITHGLWQRRYGGARDAVGRRLLVNERPFTIVGVAPRDLEYPRGAEVWVTTSAFASSIDNPTFREAVTTEMNILARLRPAFTRDQAAAELRGLAPRFDALAPAGVTRGLTPIVQSFDDALVADVRGALLVLFAAVAIVLLIASVNVANLLLMRSEGRRAEGAVRAALGATRGRLIRQFAAEGVLLAAAAAAVGLTAAVMLLPVLRAGVPDSLPRVEAVQIDATVVLFTVLLAFATATLAGLSPAFSSTRTQLAEYLRSTRAAGQATRRGRRSLAVVQVALAVIVVAAAGLLLRSVLRLQTTGAQAGADRLVLVPLSLPQAKYADRERRLQFLTTAIQRLESTAGIAAATPINVAPFTGASWGVPVFTAERQSPERAATNPSLDLEAIHPNYFDTFEQPIVRGRAFTSADSQGAAPVAIVSEDVAARAWPGEDPIGRRLKMGAADSSAPWMTVVGIAAPTRYRELRERRPTLYVPAEQMIVTANSLVLRTAAPVSAIRPMVSDQLRAIDPDVTVVRVAPFRELLDLPLARPRFNALLTMAFAAIALFLSAVGLHGVMAAFVRLHQRDIGVRIAVGASAADVRRLVVGEAARLAGLGLAIGMALSAAGNQLLRGLLFEVTPLDPAALIAAPILLVAASTLACYVPARRAARIDPATLLRAD